MGRPVLWVAKICSCFAAGPFDNYSFYLPHNSCGDTFKGDPALPGWRTCRILYAGKNTVAVRKLLPLLLIWSWYCGIGLGQDIMFVIILQWICLGPDFNLHLIKMCSSHRLWVLVTSEGRDLCNIIKTGRKYCEIQQRFCSTPPIFLQSDMKSLFYK